MRCRFSSTFPVAIEGHSLSRQFAASYFGSIGRKYREIQLSSCSSNSRDSAVALLPLPLPIPPFTLSLSTSRGYSRSSRRHGKNVCSVVATAINKYTTVVPALPPASDDLLQPATPENSRLSVFHELVMSRHLDRAVKETRERSRHFTLRFPPLLAP